MLVEDLQALPIGTQVLGDVHVSTKVPGVVASMKNGSHYIRWDDGFVSFPFGSVRDYDEYIAAHTELQPVRYGLSHVERSDHKRAADSNVYANPDYASTR